MEKINLVSTVTQFIEQWEHKEQVVAVLITGSQVTECADEYSDLDLQIITADDFQERGTRIVEGQLIEYFANPARLIPEIFKQEMNHWHRPTLRMFANGAAIHDPFEVLPQMIEAAQTALKVSPPALSDKEIKAACYTVWDRMNEMESERMKKNPSMIVLFGIHLKTVHELYCRFLRLEMVADSKQYSYFIDPEFRRRYGIEEFPDGVYASLFIQCLSVDTAEEMADAFEDLAYYVLTQMGGFDATHWQIEA